MKRKYFAWSEGIFRAGIEWVTYDFLLSGQADYRGIVQILLVVLAGMMVSCFFTAFLNCKSGRMPLLCNYVLSLFLYFITFFLWPYIVYAKLRIKFFTPVETGPGSGLIIYYYWILYFFVTGAFRLFILIYYYIKNKSIY